MEESSDVTSNSPRSSASSTPRQRGRVRSSLRARPESEKPPLWLEGVRRAEDLRALYARPAENEQKLSYVALADLVGEAFDEVGSVLPRVQQRALAGALVRDDAGDETSARITATAFVGVVAACAEKGAVLLAVDDVQWLDSASAQTLAFALRRCR